MNNIEIITGDALIELEKLKTGSVDLVIADPPYNLNDVRGFDDYLSFSRKWLEQAHRVLKPTGTLYVFMGFRFISYLYDILDRDLRMFFNSWIVWHYTQGMGKTKGFSPRHDDILMFTRSEEEFKFNIDSVRVPQKYFRDSNMHGANPGDVWDFSFFETRRGSHHPTQKPEGLIERMVLASSDEGDLVVDPFSGSGTTLRVCQQLFRRAIGIEINPEYVSSTKNRLGIEFSGFDSVDPRVIFTASRECYENDK